MGGLEEVLPAHHLGDRLARVVDHDGEVIGDADVLARQHHVAGRAGLDGDATVLARRSLTAFDKAQGTGCPLSRGEVQAPGERLAGGKSRGLFLGGQRRAAVAFRRTVRGARGISSRICLRVLNER